MNSKRSKKQSLVIKSLASRILKKYQPKLILIFGGKERRSAAEVAESVLGSKYQVAKIVFNGHGDLDFVTESILLGEEASKNKGYLALLARAYQSLFFRKKYPTVIIIEASFSSLGRLKRIFLSFEDLKLSATILTTVADTEENYRKVKTYFKEIKKIGAPKLIVLNNDFGKAPKLTQEFEGKLITSGLSKEADYYLDNLHFGLKNPSLGASYQLHYGQNFLPVRLPYVEKVEQVYSSLFAAILGENFGINLIKITEILAAYDPEKK